MKLGDLLRDSDLNHGFFYSITFRGSYADAYVIVQSAFPANNNHLHRECSESMYRGLVKMVMI